MPSLVEAFLAFFSRIFFLSVRLNLDSLAANAAAAQLLRHFGLVIAPRFFCASFLLDSTYKSWFDSRPPLCF